MFFNPANMGYIISLVQDANVYAIYPEREYKLSHEPSCLVPAFSGAD
jgi:hypothetical protein